MRRLFGLFLKIPALRKLLKAPLKTKVNVYYITVLIPAFLALFFATTSIDAVFIRRQMMVSSQQTLEAVDKNYSYILQNVYQFSDYLYFDEEVQNALRSTKQSGINPSIQEIINKSLINMIISSSDIASAYLLDNYGNCYSMSKLNDESVDYKHLTSAPWYEKVLAAQGKPIWVLDNGDTIQMADGSRPVSLARVICDVNTYKSLGFLLINIDVDALQERVGSGSVFLIDQSGAFITHTAELKESDLPPLPSFAGKSREEEVNIDGEQCLVVSAPSCVNSEWTLVGVFPVTELAQRYHGFETAMLLIVPVTFLLLLVGQLYIKRLVVNPLAKMRASMSKVREGVFEPIPVDSVRDDEIVQLKRVFNHMVKQIGTLINKVREEQEQLRKSELATLRAQINPHFLYNTLDAVSALSIIGDNKSAFKLTQALERFYRISLSSGQDIVTVDDEMRCIDDYITILNIRYKGIFRTEYKIDPDIRSLPILKLILQPFVENAISHGLKEKEGGLLTVRGCRIRNTLMFSVEDDGVGMPQEKADYLLHTEKSAGRGGFGIYNSIVRISLFYGVKNPVQIESCEGKGTRVIIRIPVLTDKPPETERTPKDA